MSDDRNASYGVSKAELPEEGNAADSTGTRTSSDDETPPQTDPADEQEDPSPGENDVRILTSARETDAELSSEGLLVWGHCLEESRKKAGLYFLRVNPETGEMDSLKTLGFESVEELSDFDLRWDPRQFHQNLEDHPIEPDKINQTLQDHLARGLEEQISDPEAVERLEIILQSEDRDAFEQWNREWLERGTTESSWTLQCRGFAGTVDRIRPPEPKQEDERTYLDISLMTSPARGIPAHEVVPGDEVSLRVRDESIKYLPPSKVDERREAMSVPLEGVIEEIHPDPRFPDDFDGDPEQYREVIVKLDEAIHGRGFMYDEDKIKVHRDPEPEETLVPWLSIALSLFALLVLVVAVFFIL